MPKPDYSNLDEFLASLDPDELNYVCDAATKMRGEGDKEGENESMMEEPGETEVNINMPGSKGKKPGMEEEDDTIPFDE